ncbi:Uma2 family endonuclease [Kibdelosporangium lantanae]|uniref:Uma2 family endonuclease n=1 Tax=Kibdelosporangium lantanae TaxID=1497396 RepID=A0ABW3M7Q1_9PSEU
MPDDGHRFELVDGVLVMSPSPRPLHQRAVARLLAALTQNCPADLEVLPAPVDVILADDTVLIPDVVVGRRENYSTRGLEGPPVLAIEVHSPSTRLVDLELKRARLQEAGCPHYWLVDPDIPTLRCLTLRGGVYEVTYSLAGPEFADLAEPYPVRLSPDALVNPYGID